MDEIRRYSFGSMSVGDTTYRRDLVILPDRVLSPWRRREGHVLNPEDLGEVVAAAPELVVIGSGAFGRMCVSGEARLLLAGRGIRAEEAPTKEAVRLFNAALHAGTRTAGAFHLTC